MSEAIRVLRKHRDQAAAWRDYHKRVNPVRGNVEAMLAAIIRDKLTSIIKEIEGAGAA
jgi:hypothetical protein